MAAVSEPEPADNEPAGQLSMTSDGNLKLCRQGLQFIQRLRTEVRFRHHRLIQKLMHNLDAADQYASAQTLLNTLRKQCFEAI